MTNRVMQVLCAMAVLVGMSASAQAADYYVSVARGRGKVASKEQPAKDLGNIASQLKDGDVVHVAQGTYLGRGDSGADLVPVAIRLLGGYSDDFSKRDPWGQFKTIFAGTNAVSGSTDYRLAITAKGCTSEVVVSGIIFDNGPRNRYTDANKLVIARQADMARNENATPEAGGIRVTLDKQGKATIENNVVMNTAPTGGAIAAWGHHGTQIVVRNNLIINNTGEGIFALSVWHPRDAQGNASFVIENNTVLFSWKHDAIATYGGNALKMDTDVTLVARNNVFAFGDYGGVDNIKRAKGMTLKDNLFAANKLYDYREFNTNMTVAKLEDEAELLSKETLGNVTQPIKLPVGERWANIYASRVEVSRAAVDSAAKVPNTGANALRGMLGLPLQATGVRTDANVWLPLLEVDDALRTGQTPYLGKYGCRRPTGQ